MIQEKAQAISSAHCMGNPRGCLTFSKLNDLGLVGACEGDIDSTLTMLMFAYAFRVPGFITDPVIDTAKNAMIHFHCTSATKMDGPERQAAAVHASARRPTAAAAWPWRSRTASASRSPAPSWSTSTRC